MFSFIVLLVNGQRPRGERESSRCTVKLMYHLITGTRQGGSSGIWVVSGSADYNLVIRYVQQQNSRVQFERFQFNRVIMYLVYFTYFCSVTSKFITLSFQLQQPYGNSVAQMLMILHVVEGRFVIHKITHAFANLVRYYAYYQCGVICFIIAHVVNIFSLFIN